MVDEIKVSCWDEFEIELEKLEDKRRENKSSSEFLYRGQGDCEYLLSTTLERYAKQPLSIKEYHHIIFVAKPQIEAFSQKRWDILSYPDGIGEWLDAFDTLLPSSFGNPQSLDTYSYMSYLRHFGFPSPLLDWSSSPYVAAYFAFRDSSPKEHVAIYVYLESIRPIIGKLGASDKAEINVLGPYVRSDKRHFIQQSKYTISVRYRQGEWVYAPHTEVFDLRKTENDRLGQDLLWKIKIPFSERNNILKKLDSYNINALSIFGSEESLMETMALRRFNF